MGLVEGVFPGTTDMVLTSDAVLSNLVPETGLINLPFIFEDSDHVRATLDGEMLADRVAASGAHVVGWCENGFRHVTKSTRPIEGPDDLRGLKIRLAEGPIFADTFTELYSALQPGTVDGQENLPAHILTRRFYEVQHYARRTGRISCPRRS